MGLTTDTPIREPPGRLSSSHSEGLAAVSLSPRAWVGELVGQHLNVQHATGEDIQVAGVGLRLSKGLGKHVANRPKKEGRGGAGFLLAWPCQNQSPWPECYIRGEGHCCC